MVTADTLRDAFGRRVSLPVPVRASCFFSVELVLRNTLGVLRISNGCLVSCSEVGFYVNPTWMRASPAGACVPCAWTQQIITLRTTRSKLYVSCTMGKRRDATRQKNQSKDPRAKPSGPILLSRTVWSILTLALSKSERFLQNVTVLILWNTERNKSILYIIIK